MSTIITKDAVLLALGKVQEPELNKDLVSLNMIKDLTVEDGTVSFSVVLTTPACPLRGKIEKESREAVEKIPGVKKVLINMISEVRGKVQTAGNVALSIKNTVAIASGKGGVGKSTVSVNVAVALAQSGAKVGLLDADIYGPNIPTMMGLDRLPAPKDGKLMPAEAYGVKVMSIGFLVKPGQPLIWRGPMLHSAIRQFLEDVEWGDLDYLIIDLPPGTGDAQLSLAQILPLSGGVIVTLPQQVSLEDASRGLQMFKELNIPLLGVVENMSYLELPDGTRMEVFGSGGGMQLAQSAGIPFIGQIPMDPTVRAGGDAGTPVVIDQPDKNSAMALKQIAGIIAARLSVQALLGNPMTINIVG